MGVEIINDKVPAADGWVGCDGSLNMIEKVLFGPGWTTRYLPNLPGRHLKIDDETERAVPHVFKLPALNFSGT